MSRRPGRPRYLPEQEPVAGTVCMILILCGRAMLTIAQYLDGDLTEVGSYQIDRITCDSTESEVRDIWSTILGTVFTTNENYILSHEAYVEGGRIDIRVSRLVNRRTKPFLILELKRSSYSNSTEALQDAETQLVGYLNSLGRVDYQKLWAALCIGKNVQFYKIERRRKRCTLSPMHKGMLRIDRQPQMVTDFLEEIKDKAT